MQLATLFHENVAVITTAADVASTGSIPKASVFKDKSIKVKDMSTFSSASLASGGKLIELDTSSDSSLLAMEIEANEAVIGGTSGRGLEMRKRKQSFECVKPSNRQTQPKDRRIHNALWKKVKSEQQIMTVNSSNKKYLRSLLADELLNTRLHLTTESSKEKHNYHDREQNTDNADYENCNNKHENTNIESGSTDNNIKQFANYIKTSLKEESSFNICTNDAVGTESNASTHNTFDRLEDEKETNVISGIASQNIKAEGGDDDTDVDGSEFDNEKRSPLANKLYTPKNAINANEIRAYGSAKQSEITEKIDSNIETNSVPVVYESCKIIDSCIEKADQLTEKAIYENSGETQQKNQQLAETTGNQHMLNDAINTGSELLHIGNCSSKSNDEYLRYVTFTPNRVTDVHGNEYTNNCHHSGSKSCDGTAPDNTTTYKYLNPPQPAYPQNGTCLNDKNTEVIQAIHDMKKSSLDDSGPRTDMRSSSMQHDDCATYERSSASNADGFSITDQLSAKNNMRSDNCDGSNKLNNNHWQNDDDKYLDGRESTHTDENNSDFKLAENERKQLNILENKMKLQDILFSREQPQLHEFQNEIKQEDMFQRPANSYHSYSERCAQSTNSTNADIEKQEKYYTSAINTTRRDRDIYQLADLHQQQQHHSHNQSKEQMENAAGFSHIQNFENPHHMHQQKQQNYEQIDKQQQQQQLQHLRPNQTNMQYFDQNQHFLYQQKELQTVNSSYNLHQDFHNQTQSEMQKSLTQQELQHNLQQRPHQQQHQRHFDQPSHFMSYLNQENHFRQRQRAYHQHQRMNPESNLLLSPHPNNNPRKQEIDKLQSTSLSSTNNKLSTIDELMIDEYREQNHNVEFKLTLSPTNAIKNENQDDGYETSAGDVLTPNSHSSSRHSITPQHQTQYTNNLLPPTKCGDPQFKSHPIQFSISNTPMNSQQLEAAHNIMTGGEMNQEISENTASPAVADAYNFIDDELNATVNIRKTPQQAVEEDLIASERNYLPMQAGTTRSEQHQQQPSTIITSQPQDFNNRNMLNSNNNNIFDEKIKEGCCDILNPPSQKRRGRKKKVPLSDHIPEEIPNPLDDTLSQQQNPQSESMTACIIKTKERKKHDRFNGLPEEEVAKRILPDHLCDNLDIVIVGINPGLFAAYKGHHYAGPGNHFWKCLYLSGLTHEQMGSDEDYKLVKYGIGFTNMVQRATKGSADLTRKEIKEGSRILLEKLQRYRPKIAVFNGKLIFEVFSGKKDFNFGRQPECVDGTDTYIWVMPSSSARCAQLPRAADKVPFYAALKKFRDYLNGLIPHMEESECVFNEPKFKQGCEENLKQLELVSGNSALQEQGVGGLYDTSRNILASQTPKIIDNDEHVLEKTSCVNISSQEHQQCCSQQQQMHAYMYGDNYISASSMVMPKSGSDPSRMSDTTDNRYILPDCHTLQPPQKKKRGRPKKIKEGMGQEIISTGTRNKMNLSGQTQGCANDFSNILNLSMMAAVGAEIPKKKRGRPKKIKVPLNMNQSSMETRMHITNSMSVQGVPIEHVSSPKQHVLYNSPQQHNIQQGIFGHSSPPVGSPVGLHSGFTRATPPSNHLVSAIQIDEQLCISQHDEKLGSTILGSTQKLVAGNNDSYYTEKLLNSSSASSPHVNQMQQHLDSSTSANIPSADSKLEESSVPNSPNICPVDFETAKATSNTLNLEKDMDKGQVQRRQRFQEYSPRYNSPTHEHLTEDHYPTNEQHFNQWPSPSQAQRPVASHPYSYNPSRLYQTQNMSYQEEHNLHHLHEQQTQYNTSFPSHWQRLQEPQCYEPNAANYLVRHPIEEHINAPEVQTYQQLSSDVTSKSLSGLESLVDQIPTISATDSVASNSLSATAAAAVETRLQSMLPIGNTDYRNSNNNICESSEMYAENVSNNITNIAKHAGDSNGSNTPQPVNNIYGSGSPGNYHTNTRHSSTPVSSPVSLRSPNFHSQTEPLHDLHHQQKHVDLLPPSTPGAIMNSSPKTVSRSTPPMNSSLSGSVVGHGASYSCSSSRNISSNVHTSNFSVSHLAASSATVPSSVANINQNYLPSPTHHTIYHRSNLLPSIPPAASAHSSPNESTAAITNAQHMSSFPQMYMNPHPHLSVPVNTIYPHLHPHTHHHGHSCGPPAQHSPLGDYDTTPYGSPSAAATAVQTSLQDSPVHTLHIPSPNYPYGYATPPTQSSYTSPMHAQSTPPPTAAVPPVGNAGYHHAQHHHYHHGHNATHHLSMFERLKPTDIGSYGGF